MTDDVIKKVDKLTMLIRRLEHELPEINQRIDRIERTQRSLRDEIGRCERQIIGRVAAFPEAWRERVTHDGPPLIQ
jgi:predicted  nucleic acid-binding Zn-ribbon protein